MVEEARQEPTAHDGKRRRGGWLFVAFGVLLALAALYFIGGGAYLIWLGGSPYFLLIGLALLVSGLLVARRDVRGFWLYAIIFAATVIWALWDAGTDFWPLVSRLYAPAVLLLLMCLAAPFLWRRSPQIGRTPAFVSAGIVAIGLIVTAVAFFRPHDVVRASTLASVIPVASGAEQREWRHYGNTTHGRRFAALDQINRDNVDQLEVAWTFRTGDIAYSGNLPEGTMAEADEVPADPEVTPDAEDQNTPIQIGDTLYLCTPRNIVIAVDVDSGRERWRFDPRASSPNWQRCRGVSYHGATSRCPAGAADRGRGHTGAVRAAHPPQHARCPADRARCRHGPALRGLRVWRDHRLEEGSGAGPSRFLQRDFRAAHCRRPGRRRRSRHRQQFDRRSIGGCPCL